MSPVEVRSATVRDSYHFLSALDEKEDKVKAFTVGGADYITKPFQAEEVLVRVRNQMTIQQLKKQVARQEQQLEQATASLPNAPVANGGYRVGMNEAEMGEAEINEAGFHQPQEQALSAIATILDYSDHLCQNPAINSEQYAALQVIRQNGRLLLNLVNTQLGSSIH